MTNDWIDVNEKMPPVEVPVLVHCVRTRGDMKYNFVATCFYEDGTIWRDESDYCWGFDDDYDCALKYNEEKDDYLVCAGWFESVNFADEFSSIDSDIEIVAWMNLPKVN